MNYDHWRHYARGWLLHFFDREDSAFAAFSEAYRHDRRDFKSAQHLASIAVSKGKFDVAEKWFEVVLQITPEDSAIWFNLGFVRERMGKPREAIAAFAESVRHNASQDRAWYGMGLAQARIGAHAEAAAALEKSVELQPMNGEGWYQLGMAWHHANQPDQVKRVVKRLVDFEPKRAKRLVQDAERADLMHLIPELPF
jgi:tetratricopeptide (TPR) repeat protein